jgi:hypothetical protein
MAAVSAACIGIPTFSSSKIASDVVQVAESPFAAGQLASHWLRHMTGGLDYPSGCENLLTALAAHYGNPVSPSARGVPEPPHWVAKTPAEARIARQPPPYRLSRAKPEAYDRYRWGLFDTSLDDHSLRDWRHKFNQRAKAAGGQ